MPIRRTVSAPKTHAQFFREKMCIYISLIAHTLKPHHVQYLIRDALACVLARVNARPRLRTHHHHSSRPAHAVHAVCPLHILLMCVSAAAVVRRCFDQQASRHEHQLQTAQQYISSVVVWWIFVTRQLFLVHTGHNHSLGHIEEYGLCKWNPFLWICDSVLPLSFSSIDMVVLSARYLQLRMHFRHYFKSLTI